MTLFSKLKMSKKAAKDHKQKGAEKENKEVVAVPYKHIPTHAAVDALRGSPLSWMHQDLPKIREHRRIRGQMAMSRPESSVSSQSCLHSTAYAPSAVAVLPRSISYQNFHPGWIDRSSDIYYSGENIQNRYKPSRGHSYHESGTGSSIGPSPLGSNCQPEGSSPTISETSEQQQMPLSITTFQSQLSSRVNSFTEVIPAVSSGTSQSSNSCDSFENSELSVTPRQKRILQRQRPTVYPERDIFQRLHTSTTRKLGEAPVLDTIPTPLKPPVSKGITQEVNAKKPRWSLLGRRNTIVIAA